MEAGELLDSFGADEAVPGCGSAAALLALVSANLSKTVCGLTIGRRGYEPFYDRAHVIRNAIISHYDPLLRRLLQSDAELFQPVIAAREKRIEAEESGNELEARRLKVVCFELLAPATDNLFEIGQAAIPLWDYAIELYDSAFQSARGDSGTAVSSAAASAISILCIVNLNLAGYPESGWSIEACRLRDDLKDEVARRDSTLEHVARRRKLENPHRQQPGAKTHSKC